MPERITVRDRFPWWKIVAQGKLGFAFAAWSVLHVAGRTYASPRVAARYAASTGAYLLADTCMNYRLGTLTKLVVLHHAVMGYFPWAIVALDISPTMWYLMMCAGSTELGVALFYVFLRAPHSKAARTMARLGLLQRTLAVAECARTLILGHAAQDAAKHPITVALMVLILAINQYYTYLFYRKYARMTSG